MSDKRLTARVSILSCLAAAILFGQSEVATITGTVSDATGGVLANVAVTLTNQETNVSTSTTTNESGRYSVPSLRPGVSSVAAAPAGSKKNVQTGVILQVNQSARLDITPAVGDTSEQVTVEAAPPLLETENSSRGAVIDGRKIVELPL